MWTQQRAQDDISQVQARRRTLITTPLTGCICARILSSHGIMRRDWRSISWRYNRDKRGLIVMEVIIQWISGRKIRENLSGITWCGMEVIFEKRALSGEFWVVWWVCPDGHTGSYEAFMFTDMEWIGAQFVCLSVWLCGMNMNVHICIMDCVCACMLFAIVNDHVHNMRDYHRGLLFLVDLLHCPRSTYEATTYMYYSYIEYHNPSRYCISLSGNFNDG